MQQDQKWYGAFRAFLRSNWRVIWRILEFVGLITAIAALGVGVWALIETRKSNKLAREAMEEARKLSRESINKASEANKLSRESINKASEANKLAREAIDDSRIAQSWQIVTTRAPGSSGKKQALERLYASGESLQGVDLSCQTMGGWDDEKQGCTHRTNLQGLDLAKTEGGTRANLKLVNFSYADMWDANLTGADMVGADLLGAKMSGANLSGAVFCSDSAGCAENLSQEQIEGAWAWADRPPVFKAGGSALELYMPPFCDTGLREAYEANQEVGKPEGC